MGRVEYLIRNVNAVEIKQFGHPGKLVDALIANIPFYGQGDEIFFSTDILRTKSTENDPTETEFRMLYFKKSKSQKDDTMPAGIYLETFAKYEDFDQKFERRLTGYLAEQCVKCDFTQDDLQLKPYGITEKHQLLVLSLSLNQNSNISIFEQLFHGNPENPTTVAYKKVRITNKDNLSLIGLLTGTSIVIPHSSSLKDEEFIKDMVEINWQTFHSIGGEKITASFSRFLNTDINTTKNGFHTMNTIIEGVHLIHIYPHMHFETQEDFVKAFTEAYKSAGFEVSIENPSS